MCSSEARFQKETLGSGNGSIYARYHRLSDDIMDENYFPILWTENGRRTSSIEHYLNIRWNSNWSKGKIVGQHSIRDTFKNPFTRVQGRLTFQWSRRLTALLISTLIVDSADFVLAFWDGKSKGTKSVIEYCKKQGKPYAVRLVNSENK